MNYSVTSIPPIENVINTNTLLWSCFWKQGKSLGLDIAFTVACKNIKKWHGYKVNHGNVVYVTDDEFCLKHDIESWKEYLLHAYDCKPERVDFHVINVKDVLNHDTVKNYTDKISQAVNNEQVLLIILDSRRQFTKQDSSEKYKKQVDDYITASKELTELLGCSLLTIFNCYGDYGIEGNYHEYFNGFSLDVFNDKLILLPDERDFNKALLTYAKNNKDISYDDCISYFVFSEDKPAFNEKYTLRTPKLLAMSEEQKEQMRIQYNKILRKAKAEYLEDFQRALEGKKPKRRRKKKEATISEESKSKTSNENTEASFNIWGD